MKSTGSLDLLNEDVRRALAAFDGLRLGSFAITEQAEILQWIQRTQPYLNANVRSDVFVSEADRQRLSVPRSPFNEHTLETAMAPELWNVVVHRIIYADYRLTIVDELIQLSDSVSRALASETSE